MRQIYNSKQLQRNRRRLRRDLTVHERMLWKMLRRRQIEGLRFLRQYSIGPYILDFYCPKIRLALELDGGQHNEDEAIEYDQERTRYLELEDMKVLRFWNNIVVENMGGVLMQIREVALKLEKDSK